MKLDGKATSGDLLGRLRPMEPLEALESFFRGCSRDSIFAFGERSLPKKAQKDADAEPFPRVLVPYRPWQLDLACGQLALREAAYHRTQYFAPNTLRRSALNANGKMQKTIAACGWDAWQMEWDLEKEAFFEKANRHVEELCALVIDIDVGRPDSEVAAERISASDAISVILTLADRGTLPMPSLVAFSGRGCYVVWLLAEAAGPERRPPLATDENNHVWRACHDKIAERAEGADLPLDSKAKAPSNWYKLPGTLDTKTGNRVAYFAATPGPEPLYHPLHSFALALGAEKPPERAPAIPRSSPPTTLTRPSPTWERPCTPPPRPGSRSPSRRESARWRAVILEIEAINEKRGGMTKGVRQCTLWYYAQAWYNAVMIDLKGDENRKAQAREIALQKCRELNASFRPPLPDSEVRNAQKFRHGQPGLSANGATIASALRVSEQEAEALSLATILPPSLYKEKKRQEHAERAKAAKKRASRQLRKRLAIDMISRGHPIRAVAEAVEIPRSTVHRWAAKARKEKPLSKAQPALKAEAGKGGLLRENGTGGPE